MSQPISEGESGTVENSSGQTRPTEAAPETVLAELEKILSSKVFAHSERHSRFLRFVVEQTLQGKGDELKEYLLGVEVFHRPPSFDPRIDSTVRTEASRLRSRLKEYYEGEGRDDPILIELLKGSYIPLFQKPDVSPNQIPLTESKTGSVSCEDQSDSGALGVAIGAEKKGRRRWFWLAGAVAVILALVGTAVYFRKSRESPEPSLAAVPLTTFAGMERWPSFSPDGNAVALAWNGDKQDNYDIYVKLIGGADPLRLTKDPAFDYSPAWSPDGRSIAFLRDLGNNTAELLLIPYLGGPERRLLPSPLSLAVVDGFGSRFWRRPSLAWTPDGQHVICPASADPYPRLLLLSIATGEKRQLTHPPTGTGDYSPALSPDGGTLAFGRFKGWVSHLYLLPLSDNYQPAGEPRLLVTQDQMIHSLAWTTDGREIIYSAGKWLPERLWRVAVSGSGSPSPVTSVGDNIIELAISRQGHRLVYSTVNADRNIWRVEVFGDVKARVPVKLIKTTRGDDDPQYSPDGKRIAFASDRSGAYEIWVCDQDGSNSVQLTFFKAVSGMPYWFPDGQRLVFESNKEGQNDIYVIDTGGGVARRLTDNPAFDAFPSVSRDGRWIYFQSSRTGRGELWRTPAEGGQAIQLTRNGGFRPLESLDGKILYYEKEPAARTLSRKPRFSPVAALDIWKIPVEGGEETKVFGPIASRMFAVARDGIYFIGPTADGDQSELQFYHSATSAIRKMRITGEPGAGLSASPDGRFIIYSQKDEAGADLMLVENFR